MHFYQKPAKIDNFEKGTGTSMHVYKKTAKIDKLEKNTSYVFS